MTCERCGRPITQATGYVRMSLGAEALGVCLTCAAYREHTGQIEATVTPPHAGHWRIEIIPPGQPHPTYDRTIRFPYGR